ncbi:MAG: hypothetical protein E7656_00570 [Ruminococcaceae bacterium]|nr:hypothetical protein [Oscillospiraceae bacterium]
MKKRSLIFILILGFAVLFGIVATSIYFAGIDSNSKGKNDLPELPGKVQLPGNNEKIYESLESEKNKDLHVYPAVSHETVKELLSSLETPDIYYWYFNSTIISSEKERTTNGILKYNNGTYMIENYSNSPESKLEKTIVLQDDIVSVQTHDRQQMSVAEFSAKTTSAFIEAGVPDISTFINDSGADFRYSMHDSEYGKMIYAEFELEKDGYSQEQRYYISLDFGIVIKAECYENYSLVYALNTITLYELENS